MEICWSDVEAIFEDLLKDHPMGGAEIQDSELDHLCSQLARMVTCHDAMEQQSEGMREHCICSVLLAAMVPGVEMQHEVCFTGQRIRARGKFKFLLKKGSKFLCVVQTEEENFAQGAAQALLGCEVLADIEQLACVYAIVTNYVQWAFYECRDDKIFRHMTALTFQPGAVPTRDSLAHLTGILHKLLLDA